MKVGTRVLLCCLILGASLASPSKDQAAEPKGESASGAAIESPGDSQPHAYRPPEGFVPDEKTAVTIAEAILGNIYGKKHIRRERPFHASLSSAGIWVVAGSLPDNHLGGVAAIEISKLDGCVLRVTHGK